MSDNLSRLPLIASLGTIIAASGCVSRSEPLPAPRPAPPMAARAARTPVTRFEIRAEDLYPQDYRIHPGDVLELGIYDLVNPGMETRKAVRVDADGNISLPLVGQIHVAGLTEGQANATVNQVFRARVCR